MHNMKKFFVVALTVIFACSAMAQKRENTIMV